MENLTINGNVYQQNLISHSTSKYQKQWQTIVKTALVS